MSREDPFALPEWQAISRECKLVRQLVGSGVTVLGMANYADKKGEYYVAFFGLSVGIERLAKLILVAARAIQHDGNLPSPEKIRKFGHRLIDLLNTVDQLKEKYSLDLQFPRPEGSLPRSIVGRLDSFADARRGRYANFDTIGDPDLGSVFEPIKKWWNEVAEPILVEHFYGKSAEHNVRSKARLLNALIGSVTLVRHTSEDGRSLTDVESASFIGGATPYVQKYSRYCTLSIVRWLSDVFRELTHFGCYDRHIDALFGHHDHFNTYTVDDEFLKTRKRWPLSGS